MRPQEALGAIVRASPGLLTRYAAGFDDASRIAQAPNLPNHLAWILGHCALTMHRCAEKLDARPLPDSDFVMGDGRSGTPSRFDTESICFGSTPVADASLYPSLARCIEIFQQGAERLATTVQSLSDAEFERTHTWGEHSASVSDLITRMVTHNGTHTGQLVDLRRALGMGSIF